MKRFFLKSFLASVLGSLVAMILAVVFFIFLAAAIVSSTTSDEPVKIKPGSVLKISLQKPIAERSDDDPFRNFSLSNLKPSRTIGMDKMAVYIQKAATDENIAGIYIDGNDNEQGWAVTEEIRNALLKFRESGKFIVSYADAYNQKSYYLASVSTKMFLNPEGLVPLLGLGGNHLFFKGTFEKLGIQPQVIRHGKYKSYVEIFVNDKMSDENRAQTLAYVGDIWHHVLEGISAERKVSVDSLNYFADNLILSDAQAAKQHKLIDSIIYKDQVIDYLSKVSFNEPGEVEIVTLNKYMQTPAPRKSEGLAKNKIAVVFASGDIVMGEGDDDEIGGEKLSRAIREARRDSSIKAIVLRINSPGGSAQASDVIWREVVLARQVKPVIVSMGDVAASGGYYIACAADSIVASPTTITGSIGVFGILMNVQTMLKDKFGITVDAAKTNPSADLGSPMRPITEQERAVITNEIERTYTTFVTHVSEGRHLTPMFVDSIAQGRVWSGVSAKKLGLVDEFGGLDRAIEIAAQKAGLSNYRIQALPKLEDPFESFMNSIYEEKSEMYMMKQLGAWTPLFKELMKVAKYEGVMARIPFEADLR
jgi:protease-4